MGAPSTVVRAYEPRRARESPLYRLVIDELESWVNGLRGAPGPGPEPCAEDSLRAFLGCGVHRFGVVRYRCGRCGESLMVPFCCKRRMACPSCDAKRSAMGSAKAAEELLPEVPYRQWVLVIPKRLRYFVNRDKRLPGELSAILARTLTRHYSREAPKGAVPAQFHVIQRFGSRVNLHVHDHAVVSDGAFTLEDGVLQFHPTSPPSDDDLAAMSRTIRRKVLLRMRRLGAVPEEALEELSARPLGGFSLDGSVRTDAKDRPALGRLLSYILRPAISVKRLSYSPEKGLVRYWPKKGKDGAIKVLEFKPADFLARFARLIPPARAHLVRHYGALGPRSPLREAVTRAAKDKADFQRLLDGIAMGAAARAVRAASRGAKGAIGGWAACLAGVCPPSGGPRWYLRTQRKCWGAWFQLNAETIS